MFYMSNDKINAHNLQDITKIYYEIPSFGYTYIYVDTQKTKQIHIETLYVTDNEKINFFILALIKLLSKKNKSNVISCSDISKLANKAFLLNKKEATKSNKGKRNFRDEDMKHIVIDGGGL